MDSPSLPSTQPHAAPASPSPPCIQSGVDLSSPCTRWGDAPADIAKGHPGCLQVVREYYNMGGQKEEGEEGRAD